MQAGIMVGTSDLIRYDIPSILRHLERRTGSLMKFQFRIRSIRNRWTITLQARRFPADLSSTL